MTQQQRQRALPDGTEADNDKPALKLDVLFLVHFQLSASRQDLILRAGF
jgi:hypothetical protein